MKIIKTTKGETTYIKILVKFYNKPSLRIIIISFVYVLMQLLLIAISKETRTTDHLSILTTTAFYSSLLPLILSTFLLIAIVTILPIPSSGFMNGILMIFYLTTLFIFSYEELYIVSSLYKFVKKKLK